MNRFDRRIREYLEHYCTDTDLEIIKQQMITLEMRIVSAELEVAEISDKAYASLKRLEMRQRREVPTNGPVVVEDDPITAKILRRRAARAVPKSEG